MIKKLFFLSIIVALIFAGIYHLQAQDTGHIELEDKKALFISSYHASFDTLEGQITGIEKVFDKNGIAFDIDYMDTKRLSTQANYDNYYSFLKHRLESGEVYDVVLVGDDNGLQFIMDHRESLFPDTPIVFFCVNDIKRADKANALPLVTGIVESISVENNVQLATDLMPKAKEIIGIIDNTATGLGDRDSFMAVQELFPDYTFNTLNASEYTFKEFENVLQEVGKDEILFYLSMFEDKNGERKTIAEAVEMIVDHTNTPVFRMSIGGVGQGILGGNMVSYEEQGRLAANMAVSILQGSDPDGLGMIRTSPNKNVFDYQVLKAYGINLRKIPSDTIFINEPTNYFEKYKKVLIPGTVLFVFLLIILWILYRDNQKLKEKDVILQNANQELVSLNEELIASTEEIQYQYDQLILSKQALDKSEEKYKKLAYTDTLTGLDNRTALFESFGKMLENKDNKWLLMYLDLDNFKYVNDSQGHIIGDYVLKTVGARLTGFKGEYSHLCRLGGDEFVMIIDNKYSLDQINEVVDHILKEIEKAIVVDNNKFYLSASIGIAGFPDDGETMEVLLRKADIAMYKAKDSGKNKFVYYNNLMEEAIVERLDIQNSINFAIENSEFELFYQPQYDVAQKRILGVEALIRWRKADGEYIPPGSFIPVAEECGLIDKVGQWVQARAIEELKIINEFFGQEITMAVNVSVVEFDRPTFAEEFYNRIMAYNINPKIMAIEVTESILLEMKESCLEQLQWLREKGVQIHLDDFGSGYSSLNYLIHLPIDVLKIDRKFIKDMLVDPKHSDIVKFIVDIAHRLDKKVIAEGIETKEQYEKLCEMGCDQIQGYYYAKPMPRADVKAFITNI